MLTPEEENRNKMLVRERDRERKRMKRLDPEFRKLEQERDRDRKKARRANEAFRQLEKLRNKLRKERKKGIVVNSSSQSDFASITPVPVEPEVIISDNITTTTARDAQVNNSIGANNATRNEENAGDNIINATSVTSTNANGSIATYIPQINKGLIYPPPGFAHHPIPIPGVNIMPQLCHPILHQNLSASLYPTNGIKQEFLTDATQPSSSNPSGHVTAGGGGSSASTASSPGEEQEIALIEPEIILQTSADIIAAPHHFHNHAHAHHMHQQQCSMFQHMTPQAHMSHMRLSHSHLQSSLPPHSNHHQQQNQQLQLYVSNKGS